VVSGEAVYRGRRGECLLGIQPGHALRLIFSTEATAADCASLDGLGIPYPCTLTAPQQASLPGGEYKIFYGPGPGPPSIFRYCRPGCSPQHRAVSPHP
jgi:hypothetical protein